MEQAVLLEVCVDTLESAFTARQAGANRIELCDNLVEGGTTPSLGMIIMARKYLKTGFHPIIRPRGGDFVYSDREYEVMKADLRMCGEVGCAGVVVGMLDRDGGVDVERCAKLVGMARAYGMEVTFHRAFDVARDLDVALEDVIKMGCRRILTSGGKATAPEGVATIKRLVERAAGRISIMAGSGITPENVGEVIHGSGCDEIHGTFRSPAPGVSEYSPGWVDYSLLRADAQKIGSVLKTIETIKEIDE